MTTAAKGLMLCDDLIFASKVTATARAAGAEVRVARTAAKFREWLADAPACAIIDLGFAGLDWDGLLAERPAATRVVAFGSHVDVAGLAAARAAGCDPVLPRSAFVERLEELLPRWLGRE